MSLEDAFADLLDVAQHQGELNREAVRKATSVLVWPRYATSSDPAGLLVEDLKRVITGITTQPVDDEEPDAADAKPEAPDKSLHAYAQRYFSQEAPGSPFTYRQRLAGDPGGTARKWMSVGVIHRVLAGLLALQIEAAAASDTINQTGSGPGYRIGSVRLVRDIRPGSRLHPFRETLEYDACLLAGGPHLLVLPFPPKHTKLITVATECPSGHPQPQLVSVVKEASRVAAVVFGAQQGPGERVRIEVEHQPRRLRKERNVCHASYRVDQPMGELVLHVCPNVVMTQFDWRVTAHDPVTSDTEVVERPITGSGGCRNPDIGKTYTLYGSNPRPRDETVWADELARAAFRGSLDDN